MLIPMHVNVYVILITVTSDRKGEGKNFIFKFFNKQKKTTIRIQNKTRKKMAENERKNERMKKNTKSPKRSRKNTEEIRERALQYYTDLRYRMKDIEHKYQQSRYQRCDRNNNPNMMINPQPSSSTSSLSLNNNNNNKQSIKRLQCTSVSFSSTSSSSSSSSSSSIDDSDDIDEQKPRISQHRQRRSSSTAEDNAAATMNSLRRIKTLRKAVMRKIKKDDNVKHKDGQHVQQQRKQTKRSFMIPIHHQYETLSSDIQQNTSFDIRTRASMRRTRQSKSQHRNRSKNNFLYQQYDGNHDEHSYSNHSSSSNINNNNPQSNAIDSWNSSAKKTIDNDSSKISASNNSIST